MVVAAILCDEDALYELPGFRPRLRHKMAATTAILDPTAIGLLTAAEDFSHLMFS